MQADPFQRVRIVGAIILQPYFTTNSRTITALPDQPLNIRVEISIGITEKFHGPLQSVFQLPAALNNFIVDPRGVFNPRGVISIEAHPVDGTIIQRNIIVLNTNGLKPFYLKDWLGPVDPVLSETDTDNNLYWHTLNPHWAEEHLAQARKENREQHSAAADPLFRNPDQADFRFKKGSAARRLGIQEIDLRKVGLRN